MNMVFLISSVLFEIGMVYCLKKSAGFKEKLWSILVILFAGLSLTMLSMAMKTKEAGIAYSFWVAMGALGSLIMGVLLFKNLFLKSEILFFILVLLLLTIIVLD